MASRKPEPFLSLGFAGIDWMEHYLVHGPGDVQGQPIELDDEFAAFVVKAYQVDGKGARKVRRAFLSRAKGRNKSGLAAMIVCFEALGPCRFDHFAEAGEVSAWGYEYEAGEPVGRPLTYVEILNVATEEGQAGNTYDAVHYMLHPETCSPALLRDYGKVDVGVTRTMLPGKRGFIEPITSSDSSKDGGKSTFIVADETHLWLLPRLKRLHGIMTRNLLKRKIASGWMLETSTMYGEGEESVAEGTHAYAMQVAAGKRNDRTLLFDHKQAGETYDLQKRSERLAALREAYGPAAAWMNLDAIADSWDDPQVSEAEFRRYWLNQPVATATHVSAIPGWDGRTDTDAAMEFVGAWGLDTSLDRELTAIGAVGPCGERVLLELIEQRPGVTGVVERMVQLDDEHGPAPVVIDAQSPASSLESELKLAGLEVRILNAREVAGACGAVCDAIRDDKAVHGPDGDLTAAVQAAKRAEMGDGLFRFARRKSLSNIAPLMAVTVAAHVLPSVLPLDDVTVVFA